MPSERRLHPATLLFDVVKHLRAFAFPALLVWFGASQSSGGPDGMFGRLPGVGKHGCCCCSCPPSSPARCAT